MRSVELPPPGREVVYFLRAPGGPVKIGTSRRLPERLKTLRWESKSALELLGWDFGGRAVERFVHRALWRWRIGPRGEWFEAHDEVLEAIRAARVGRFQQWVDSWPLRPSPCPPCALFRRPCSKHRKVRP